MELPPIATSKAVLASLGAAIAAIALAGAVGATTVDPSSSSPAKKAPTAVATKPTSKANPKRDSTTVATNRNPNTTKPSSKASKPNTTGTSKVPRAVDACDLVTPAEATAAFGHDAGEAHSVLASCLYDDGTHKLIISLTRDRARPQFDDAKATGSQAVAGLGDDAYFKDGRLGVIKGSGMMLITLTPASGPAASPALLSVARSAVTRL